MPRPAGVLDLNDSFVARSQDMTGAVGRRRRTNRCVALLLPPASWGLPTGTPGRYALFGLRERVVPQLNQAKSINTRERTHIAAKCRKLRPQGLGPPLLWAAGPGFVDCLQRRQQIDPIR